jgi:hypothetical protein
MLAALVDFEHFKKFLPVLKRIHPQSFKNMDDFVIYLKRKDKLNANPLLSFTSITFKRAIISQNEETICERTT